ncbi:unnamed protein product [Mytilus edulis]|uniref:Uncharacterized protein n=1 Tax=Mytilus edulis TaxID=6550 RepID=A0A8S3TYM8_MYTED|nr:unnamed protein product [Mytilus edulis]
MVILQMKRQKVVYHARKINTAKIVVIDVSAREMNEYQNNERIVYIGCSSILAIVVIILIAILCYKRTTQNKSGSEENNVVQWISNKNNIDENEYDEIDESLLCDIRTITHSENKMDTDEDDDDNQSIKGDVNEGYLNPYQPIISTEADVHQYSSTKNDETDNLTTSNEHHRDSGYLHPYNSLVKKNSEIIHEYTGLEQLDTGILEHSAIGKSFLQREYKMKT